MFELLLVDDEQMIREGIKNSIEWHKYDINKILLAQNGVEAEEVFLRNSPQIVITDIRMPRMNGLELIKKIHQEKPQTKIIILSGFDDFKYAQEAIKYGAFEYVLKTADIEELSLVIKKAVNAIKKDMEKEAMFSKLRKQLEISMPLLRYNYLNKLINTNMSQEKIFHLLKMINVELKHSAYRVAVCHIDSFSKIKTSYNEEEWELLKLGILDVYENVLRGKAICFEGKLEDFVCIIFTEMDGSSEEKYFEDLFDKINSILSDYYNVSVSIGLSNRYEEIVHACKGYNEAKKAIEHSFFIGSRSLVNINQIESLTVENYSFNKDNEKKLISSLRVGDYKGTIEVIEGIFNEMESRMVIGIQNFQEVCIEMLSIASRVLIEYNACMNDVCREEKPYFEQIKSFRSFENAKQWILNLFKYVIDFILNNKILKVKMITEKAKEYIESNFDKRITLNDVANIVHLSPNYFSNVFSYEEGQSFQEYLITLRIDKAKKLMGQKELKTFEIANMVGYENPQYFSRLFKKYTGFCPQEYRNKLYMRGTEDLTKNKNV